MDDDPPQDTTEFAPPDDIDDTPTISCSRCGREWALDYELEELVAGNGAVEQFALDHRRHTGHFPDDVTTWRAVCRRCPESVEHLTESPTVRWARTHARHTRHSVEVRHGDEEPRVVDDGS